MAAASSCIRSAVTSSVALGPATVEGGDEVGGDPVRCQLQSDVPHELVQGRLSGAQRDHPITRMTRQPGTQIDQPPVATRNHSWHNGLRCQEGGTQLTVQLAAELLPAQLGE